MGVVCQERKIPTFITWLTGSSNMTTKTNYQINFKRNGFPTSKEFTWKFSVDGTKIPDKSLDYDMIMGLYLMTKSGIIINCKDK